MNNFPVNKVTADIIDLGGKLLLNENGIVLAATEILPGDYPILLKPSQIFEVAAPQFTTIAKQFPNKGQISTFEMIKYEFSPEDKVFLQKFQVNEFVLFALFYAKNSTTPNIEAEIKKNFPQFLEKIENLLRRYIQ